MEAYRGLTASTGNLNDKIWIQSSHKLLWQRWSLWTFLTFARSFMHTRGNSASGVWEMLWDWGVRSAESFWACSFDVPKLCVRTCGLLGEIRNIQKKKSGSTLVGLQKAYVYLQKGIWKAGGESQHQNGWSEVRSNFHMQSRWMSWDHSVCKRDWRRRTGLQNGRWSQEGGCILTASYKKLRICQMKLSGPDAEWREVILCTADRCLEWHGNAPQRMLWIAKNKKLCELKSKLGEFMEVKLRIAEHLGVVPDSGRFWTENTWGHGKYQMIALFFNTTHASAYRISNASHTGWWTFNLTQRPSDWRAPLLYFMSAVSKCSKMWGLNYAEQHTLLFHNVSNSDRTFLK